MNNDGIDIRHKSGLLVVYCKMECDIPSTGRSLLFRGGKEAPMDSEESRPSISSRKESPNSSKIVILSLLALLVSSWVIMSILTFDIEFFGTAKLGQRSSQHAAVEGGVTNMGPGTKNSTQVHPSISQILNATKKDKRRQIVLLGGPHKTGTSSVQTNLWNWTSPALNYLPNWKWPVPPIISDLESGDAKTWQWTPSKGFYPLMESLQDTGMNTIRKSSRTIYQKYTPLEIQDFFREELAAVDLDRYNVVMGSEAMDLIVKSKHGDIILDGLSQVMPADADVTCVIVYRIPKVSHLVSMWHQNEITENGAEFWEWITTTQNTLGAIDALGMVSLILERTQWDVRLVDAWGAKMAGWDISNLLVCSVLQSFDTSIKCVESDKGMVVEGDVIQPIIKNVRSDKKPPNVDDEVLHQMDQALRSFDCNYLDLMKEGAASWDKMVRFSANESIGKKKIDKVENKYGRLRVLFPSAIRNIIDECEGSRNTIATREHLRDQLAQIARDSRQDVG